MKNCSFMKAALVGLSLGMCSVAGTTPSFAQGVHVVQKGTASNLSISMNRAVVVESDVPFGELSIANAQIADISSLSDRTIYVLGKTPGTTTLTLLDGAGRLITNIDVRVSPDISEFKERLRQILPGERIEVRTANDGIVLSGSVSSSVKLQRALELAERYAPDRVSNLMSVGGVHQVMLKVRFAEMQRSVSKSLGTSLAFNGSAGSSLGITGGTNSTSNTGSILAATSGTLPSGSRNGVISFGFDVGAVEVSMLLEALEQKGMVRTLAEPNLTALSGQEAKFLAGGEYPVPVAQDNDTTTVEFKPFGVELNFIPRVVDGDLINLEIDTSVSSIDTANGVNLNGFQIDAFSTRKTSTTVELRDGESFAISGMLQDDFYDNSGQVPWLGDVPVLGALFRSAEYQRSQSELVVIITAHLVSPTKGEVLALPTDRVRPPSEADLFLNGRLASGNKTNRRRLKGAASEVADQDFNGSYGYVMD